MKIETLQTLEPVGGKLIRFSTKTKWATLVIGKDTFSFKRGRYSNSKSLNSCKQESKGD